MDVSPLSRLAMEIFFRQLCEFGDLLYLRFPEDLWTSWAEKLRKSKRKYPKQRCSEATVESILEPQWVILLPTIFLRLNRGHDVSQYILKLISFGNLLINIQRNVSLLAQNQ